MSQITWRNINTKLGNGASFSALGKQYLDSGLDTLSKLGEQFKDSNIAREDAVIQDNRNALLSNIAQANDAKAIDALRSQFGNQQANIGDATDLVKALDTRQQLISDLKSASLDQNNQAIVNKYQNDVSKSKAESAVAKAIIDNVTASNAPDVASAELAGLNIANEFNKKKSNAYDLSNRLNNALTRARINASNRSNIPRPRGNNSPNTSGGLTPAQQLKALGEQRKLLEARNKLNGSKGSKGEDALYGVADFAKIAKNNADLFVHEDYKDLARFLADQVGNQKLSKDQIISALSAGDYGGANYRFSTARGKMRDTLKAMGVLLNK